MYSVTVRDTILVAHSLTGPAFGPAQRLHGATYVVEASFRRGWLDPHGLVVDIGAAAELLRRVLAPLNFENLDELPEFRGINTTTEFLAGEIHRRLRAAVRDGGLGEDPELDSIRVVLRESPDAWASYVGPAD